MRIAPDANDLYVWSLTETSGVYRNTGIALANNSLTDLSVNNSVIRTGAGFNFGNSLQLPGTSNWPVGSSSTRNAVFGAKTISVPPPMTVSCWVYLYSYSGSSNQTIFGKEFRDHTQTSSWTTPFNAFYLTTTTGNSGGDWAVQIANTTTTNLTFTVTDFPIPIGQWSHVGFTHDGTSLKLYLNGCQMMFYSGAVQQNSLAVTGLSYTDGGTNPGAWRVGAVLNIGSGSKEEGNMNVQDLRVANIARPLSYFKRIYSFGALPTSGTTGANTQYYKLRAYDLSCSTPTAVTWVDTQVSLANAPAFPCSGPYGNLEVLDTWII